jgi:hypothetical protein
MELITPHTMIVPGQTASGKTVFVSKLIEYADALHDKAFAKIVIAFSILQKIYLDLKGKLGERIELVEGFPDSQLNEIIEGEHDTHTLFILDDMMLELENDKRLPTLFTKMRHRNVSTTFLVHNLYFNSKYMRTVTRNCHYLVIFENPRDASMISTLGRQVYPMQPKFLPDAFRQATLKPYGYLFLDMKPGTDKKLRVREGILPNEQTFVYLPK